MHKIIFGVAACAAMLCSMNNAFGFSMEPLKGEDKAIRDTTELALGSGLKDLSADADPALLDEMNNISISMELFPEREKRADKRVYGGDLKLVLVEDNAWAVLDVTAGGRVQGGADTSVWDAASWIDRILDVGHTNSGIPTSWFLRTLADDGVDNGLNDIYLDSIVAIPEPATYGLITIFGGALLLFRRRFRV